MFLKILKSVNPKSMRLLFLIDKLSMLVTIAFSWLVFHERLTKKAAVGVLLITVGTVLLVII